MRFFFYVQIYSSKDMVEEYNKINDTLSDTNRDWEKRVEAVLVMSFLENLQIAICYVKIRQWPCSLGCETRGKCQN